MPKAERNGPVLPLLAERQRRHISNDFRRLILPRVGIEQPFAIREKRKLGRTLAPYSIHSLRHSLATWLAAAGVEESMRMRLIGHEDEAINRGYTHAGAEQAAAALAKVPGLT
jgi:integrase